MTAAEIIKESQEVGSLFVDESMVDDENNIGYDEVYLDHNHEDIQMSVDEPDQNDLVFVLPEVPGAEDSAAEDEVSVEPDGEIVVEEKPEEETDVWDWHAGGVGNFLYWLRDMMNDCPGHSGRDTTGLEKAISYFEALDREITKAMRTDYKNEIDSAKAEEARAAIEDGLERLVGRLEKVRSSKFKRHQKKTKKASESDEHIVKEAQKSTNISGIVITVPLLISHCARICINSMVSAGKDLEDTYRAMVEKYALNKREQAELVQILADMGYVTHMDRFALPDEKVYPTSVDNKDWAANYPA